MAEPALPHSPASERNRGPILAELLRLLPAQGTALEIASGTGQHAAHFAPALPGWRWQPSDFSATSLPAIAGWCAGLPHVLPPLQLDVQVEVWHGVPTQVDLVYCANMIHIAPWACTPALMRGAARHLAPQGLLILYGPYLEAGVATSPGNLAFDADLQRRNARWGLRTLQAVRTEAESVGLQLRERIAMPANNLLLVFGPSS